jgi:membrane protease YdiL (CAAX protease family)
VLRKVLLFPLTRIVIGIVLAGIGSSVVGVFRLPLLASAPLSILAILGAYLVVGKLIERRSLAELGVAPRRIPRDLVVGFLGGVLLFSAVVGLLAASGCYRVLGLDGGPRALGRGLAFFLAPALGEEIIARGLLFRILEEWVGSWAAIVVSAVLFGFAHIANPHATPLAAIAIAIEAGVLLAALYMVSRSIWLVTGLHWAWNVCEGPLYGTAVSGLEKVPHAVSSVTSGPERWTGGAFGPEAGLAALFACTAVSIPMLILAKRKGQLLSFRSRREAARARADRVALKAPAGLHGV